MTDTICDAIKGLPRKRQVYTDGESIMGVEAFGTTDQLIALVAENESLKEALEQFVDGFSCSFNEAGMCVVHYKDNVDNEPNTCWNSKALKLITLTTYGGNDDRS